MPHPPMFVDVITTKRDDPNDIHDTRRVNFNNSRTRGWLEKHVTWACKTGHAVHIAAVDRQTLGDIVRDQLQTERERRSGAAIVPDCYPDNHQNCSGCRICDKVYYG